MSLQSRIQDLYPEFTQSEKQISEYFLHHLQEVSISSAKELAAHCGTSAPTIVRFARTLGYSGFPALKKAGKFLYKILHIGVDAEKCGARHAIGKRG